MLVITYDILCLGFVVSSVCLYGVCTIFPHYIFNVSLRISHIKSFLVKYYEILALNFKTITSKAFPKEPGQMRRLLLIYNHLFALRTNTFLGTVTDL